MLTVNLCNWKIAYDLRWSYKQIKNKKSESINLKIDINMR